MSKNDLLLLYKKVPFRNRLEHLTRLHSNFTSLFLGLSWLFLGLGIVFGSVFNLSMPSFIFLGLASVAFSVWLGRLLTHHRCIKELPKNFTQSRKIQDPVNIWILELCALTIISFIIVMANPSNQLPWVISSTLVIGIGLIGILLGCTGAAQRRLDHLNLLDNPVLQRDHIKNKTESELQDLIVTALHVKEIDKADQISQVLLEVVEGQSPLDDTSAKKTF